MRCLVPALLLALLHAPAGWALEPSTGRASTKGADHAQGVPFAGPREGGDTFETAVPVPEVFVDTGNTCGYANDYDEVCPYCFSMSPEVVYVCHATLGLDMEIDLCASEYDTKIYVYDFEDGHGFGSPLVCNDDACGLMGYRSRVNLTYEPGHTYYIVVDGYSHDCGEYTIDAHEFYLPIVECAPDALPEGEPDCHDDYVDLYNGGCDTAQPAFTWIEGTPDGSPLDLCGTSGTFLSGEETLRDTDWFELHVSQPGTITVEGRAEFALEMILIDGNGGCAGFQILTYALADAFYDATMIWECEPGTYWLWIGPSVFTGVPCGSLYTARIGGYVSAPSPAIDPTWGAIKGRFR